MNLVQTETEPSEAGTTPARRLAIWLALLVQDRQRVADLDRGS